MPVELLRRSQPADENLPLAPPAPQQAADDDWSGVFCCSAMRPRPQDRPADAGQIPAYSADDMAFGN
jgi:hypothetical protein